MIRALPWLVLTVATAMAGCGYLLLLANAPETAFEQAMYVVIFCANALVGAIVAWRRPENAVGWILLLGAAIVASGFLAEQYAIYGLATVPGSLPAARLVGWPGSWVWVPGVMLLVFVTAFLFPTGRPPSPRWRPFGWFVAGATIVITAIAAFSPSTHPMHAEYRNPFPLLPEQAVAVAEPVIGLLFAVSIGGVITSVVVRFRHAGPVERQQLKWYGFAIVIVAFGALSPIFAPPVSAVAESLLMPLGIAGIPIALGIAILRHRLFDIDLVIRRTLVYGSLTGVLAAVYVGGVLLLSQVLGGLTGGDQLAVAAATLGVAAAFQPARRRIQDVVDRRFYRSRYDAARTVEAFSARLRDELEVVGLERAFLVTVGSAMQPASASLWLRGGKRA